ncbi:MAG: glycoside hydrolase family 65 protein [Planctomycetes bacterium]|nr:glycoside hydrolase family 65 protein [Planctomycetota bacterium]
MLLRKLELPPRHIYPPDEWRLVETSYDPRRMAQFETLFSTANGFLGIRGACEEGEPAHQNATLLNGFHETWPIVYGETAYGFATTGQTICDIVDAKRMHLYVDDEPFSLRHASLVEYERALDMRTGILSRELVWELASGTLVSIRSRRLVSLEHRHVAAVDYEVTVLNANVPVVVISEVVYDPGTGAAGDPHDPRSRDVKERPLVAERHYGRDRRIVLGHRTRRSDMGVACGVDHVVQAPDNARLALEVEPDRGRIVVSLDARQGEPLRVTKLIAYHWSRSSPTAELCERVERTLDRVVPSGFDALCASQRRLLDAFWKRSDVQLRSANGDGDPHLAMRNVEAVQQILRLNLFHIHQATARAEGVGVPAKGLTGTGYEGHYFWDTEIYVLPFLTYTTPRIAKNLLKQRYRQLDLARERATQVNQTGALFPWRTISGEEASAYYAAGTAQYHINADVAYALRKYVAATGDVQYLHDEGAEILVETARLWRDLGFFSEQRGGAFCITGVTGPDEYNTVVNNNTFTNLMARENLLYAADTVTEMAARFPDKHAALVHRTGLAPGEVEGWREAATRMCLPYDDAAGIHLQDDDFRELKPWDFENTPPEKYPLLLHFHPLVIYRHQVIKQADVVLAMFLLGDAFTREQKRRNFDYYDPLTTGDSSLSVCIQSIVAREVGRQEKAEAYLRYAALMDYADVARNVKDGCHIASMGGTWMALVYGIAGFRDDGGRFCFTPRLPGDLTSMRFRLTLRGALLEVHLQQGLATYALLEGGAIAFCHEGAPVELTTAQRIELPITHADPQP